MLNSLTRYKRVTIVMLLYYGLRCNLLATFFVLIKPLSITNKLRDKKDKTSPS